MAKKKSAATATKSDAIRDVLKEQPKATVKEIQAALKKRGVKASDALVNKIKYGRRTSGKRGKKSRGRRVAQVANGQSVSLEHLLAAKKVADQLGGIEVARQALASFAKLVG